MARKRTRRTHLGAAFLAFSAALALMLAPLCAQQNPALKFKEEKWDFGSVKQGKVLTHVFQFDNTGTAPLIISNVRTSCGCAAALISKREIAPGKTGEIKVTFNTKGYAGNQSKLIYVDSNDPRHPKTQLLVKAAIEVPPRPQIELDRYSIDLDLILESEDIATEAKISNPGEQELSVEFSHKSTVFTVGNKEVSSPLKIAPGESVMVSMTITPRRAVGLMREYILLRTNDPMRPNLSLYVSGYIVSLEQLQILFDRYKNKLKDKRSKAGE
jgi:hypothetical protein